MKVNAPASQATGPLTVLGAAMPGRGVVTG